MQIDFLSMTDDRLYLLSYYGDREKVTEYIPTIQQMVNSTEIYRDRTLTDSLANFELQYPPDWNIVFETSNIASGFSTAMLQPAAEKYLFPFLGGVTGSYSKSNKNYQFRN